MLSFYLTLIDLPEEKDKFTQIYNEYKDLMLNLAYSILKEKSEAEDAVHEAFLRILKNLHKIDEISCPKTKGFVVVIVKNVSKTMLQKRKKHKTLEIIEDIVGINQNVVADEIDAKYVAECIEKMPEIYKEVLYVKYRFDCSLNETAKILGISKSAVEKRFQRAKKLLKEMLNDE